MTNDFLEAVNLGKFSSTIAFIFPLALRVLFNVAAYLLGVIIFDSLMSGFVCVRCLVAHLSESHTRWVTFIANCN